MAGRCGMVLNRTHRATGAGHAEGQVARETIEVMIELIPAIRMNTTQMKAAIDGDMFATDRAVELACDGMAFRDAYVQVADEMAELATTSTAEASVQARTSPGGCAVLLLGDLQARLKALQSGG